ncbi:hypothetical protein [Rhizobium sp. P44RR-XXIV]|uniref:hypothetical protein n=1 Tax=Rhizobium sp. P44RR-XXIV TaxID=1921145 RepID=UPI00145B33B9|nr:hypothetical protein [Rhizobium sp. P44RR-XXIV]
MTDIGTTFGQGRFARDRKGPCGRTFPTATEEVAETAKDTVRGDPILIRSAARLNGIRVFWITPTIEIEIPEEVIG